MKGFKDREAASIEVKEEAGLIGIVEKKPIGSFQYWKRLTDTFELIETIVYSLKVEGSLPIWKEQAERHVQWMSLADAAVIVDEPGLAHLLKTYGEKPKASKKKPGSSEAGSVKAMPLARRA